MPDAMETIGIATSRARRFVDAGVDFEIVGPTAASRIEDADPVAAGPPFAHARLALEIVGDAAEDRRLSHRDERGLWIVDVAGAQITGRITGGGFEGRVRLPERHPWPRAAIVLSVASLLAESRGGVALHGAAVRVGDRAFVFLGPSGAGKSTACRLVEGGRELAADRVLVVPVNGALRAFRLRGGEPTGLPLTADGVEVGAILRVRHDGVRAGREELGRAAALGELRAATLVARGADEATILDRLLAIHARVPVGAIYTRLDRPLDPRSLS